MSVAVSSVLAPASPEAAHAASVSWVLIAGSGLVFVLVMAVLAWALLRRARGPAHTGRWVLLAGVGLPLAVLSGLLLWMASADSRAPATHDARALRVHVTAHNWWWEVRYRDPRSGRPIHLANELHLPADQPVTISLTSSDVIHSFWVPALGGKVDMLPERLLHLRLAAVKAGDYRGQCAEFCGEQHARMTLQVVVRDAATFAQWLDAQSRPASAPTSALAQRGRDVFAEQGCAACHAVRGLGPERDAASALRGPDLTHVGSRRSLGAGTLPNDEAALRSWLAEVQRHKPGARMPPAQIDDDSLAALAHFLTTLQ